MPLPIYKQSARGEICGKNFIARECFEANALQGEALVFE